MLLNEDAIYKCVNHYNARIWLVKRVQLLDQPETTLMIGWGEKVGGMLIHRCDGTAWRPHLLPSNLAANKKKHRASIKCKLPCWIWNRKCRNMKTAWNASFWRMKTCFDKFKKKLSKFWNIFTKSNQSKLISIIWNVQVRKSG